MKKSDAYRGLILATLAFAGNFSIWILYAVLGLELKQSLALSATELGLLFAAPMLTGALLRITAGIIADRYSPKTCFIVQMLIVVPALLLLPYAQSFNQYLYLGLWIGISGASFTLGIRYISDGFDRNNQGTAMGIFGAGNAGAAITLAFSPIIINAWGWSSIGPLFAAGLLFIAIVFALFAPKSNPIKQTNNTKRPINCLQTWRFGLYYYFVFGSFLALILWLPQYYVNAYNLSSAEAMAFTLFFVTSSSMVRALGGWISDRFGGRAVNWSVFWVCLVCLFFLSYPPTTMTIHGIENNVEISININVWVFSGLLFIIGLAQGFGRASVYKVIHDYYPQQMSSVGGFVAAIGALGGCTLPILFGLSEDMIGIHSASFMLLYGVLGICMFTMYLANKADRQQQRLQQALSNNFLDLD